MALKNGSTLFWFTYSILQFYMQLAIFLLTTCQKRIGKGSFSDLLGSTTNICNDNSVAGTSLFFVSNQRVACTLQLATHICYPYCACQRLICYRLAKLIDLDFHSTCAHSDQETSNSRNVHMIAYAIYESQISAFPRKPTLI